MDRRWLLALAGGLIALVVLPHQWLSEHWSTFDALFDPFCRGVGHTAGHALIFAVLGVALLLTVPAIRRRPWTLFPVTLVVGLAQECAQLVHKHRLPGTDEAHDLAVDLIAISLVWGLAVMFRRWGPWMKRRPTRE